METMKRREVREREHVTREQIDDLEQSLATAEAPDQPIEPDPIVARRVGGVAAQRLMGPNAAGNHNGEIAAFNSFK
jgi:hypothetical protein